MWNKVVLLQLTAHKISINIRTLQRSLKNTTLTGDLSNAFRNEINSNILIMTGCNNLWPLL